MKKSRLLLIVGLTYVLYLWACSSDKEPAPSVCDGSLLLNLISKTDAACGLDEGVIEVGIVGNIGAVSYQLNNGASQSSSVFTGLSAGSYTVTATDSEGCTTTVDVTIQNQDGVNASLTTSETQCDAASGDITISASGGQQPYEFKLDNGAYQSANTFTSLAQGNYEVSVRDASGCEVVLSAEIKTDIQFSQIQSIVQTNCAVSGCHNGTQSPNLTTAAGIQSNAGRIQARTSAGTMPPASSGRSLTNAEIAAIACWVNDGAQTN
ncbi:hypothetical protein [Roseivirga pacifica]|uniref:hypothetical protein n=1 Tax=Roseivirga pacifica TaxID=1267423 RepID=UPI0020956911|nr:hypothetical protein [Roseivirga pacifica]MCO6360570.1 hypothetical protein [Roseivirga pacifica]MCO6368459.1 hypothetical protein [Roseivirga pacifica]MCO6372601.1 hypothetical protein [Roseivirga pacifica]MCO6376659.1 hypothetical protein [Roseivirga pacifica]MCO6378061.1 hypothetical protein [Roseivirga pacifica]